MKQTYVLWVHFSTFETKITPLDKTDREYKALCDSPNWMSGLTGSYEMCKAEQTRIKAKFGHLKK